MIRALAIASAIATQRLILVPALILLGDDPSTIRWTSMISFTCAFAVHGAVAELWIRRTRHSVGGITDGASPRVAAKL